MGLIFVVGEKIHVCVTRLIDLHTTYIKKHTVTERPFTTFRYCIMLKKILRRNDIVTKFFGAKFCEGKMIKL